MTLFQPLSQTQKKQLTEFLDSERVKDGCLDFIAMHGFLTGIATGPESLADVEWLEFLFDGTPEYQSQQQQADIEKIIHQQSMFIRRSLYLGEMIDLPCPLLAPVEGETNQLSDWCFGFIEALAIDEDCWFATDELSEAVAELILPAGLLSEQFADPQLEHLSADNQIRQQMADSLIENIQNLYLLFRE